MQKSQKLMNRKRTWVLGEVIEFTGLWVLRAVVAGMRDPLTLAALRDRCGMGLSGLAMTGAPKGVIRSDSR